MQVYNSRSPDQWRLIETVADHWENQKVVDLGCGAADILGMAHAKGAHIYGVDHSLELVPPELARAERAVFMEKYIEDFIAWWDVDNGSSQFDYGICFSVLPYLDDTEAVLEWMTRNVRVAFIECQYRGDGPGYPHIRNDADMRGWLMSFWRTPLPIGETEVKDRGVTRTIWRCEA
jgi:SAM-dependent methyltransferase